MAVQVRGEIREQIERIHRERFPELLKGLEPESVHEVVSGLPKPARKGLHPVSPVNTLYYNCFGCHAEQPHGFTADGVIPAPRFFCKPGQKDRPAPSCERCGSLPHTGAASSQSLTVGRSFTPYWDISGGANWKRPPGCEYVKGRGTYIPSRQHLSDWARMNGKVVR